MQDLSLYIALAQLLIASAANKNVDKKNSEIFFEKNGRKRLTDSSGTSGKRNSKRAEAWRLQSFTLASDEGRTHAKPDRLKQPRSDILCQPLVAAKPRQQLQLRYALDRLRTIPKLGRHTARIVLTHLRHLQPD